MNKNTTPEQHRQIKDAFAAACDLDTGRRTDFLDSRCADPLVREEVESLLQARRSAGGFLEDVSAVGALKNSFYKSLSKAFIGRVVDKYRVVEEIGRGGMGVVFLAERQEFKQHVALKVIKPGMDSETILERFVRERQILAGLDHPFIAKLLDGGTTADGLPYFVIEYVEGRPINEYCRDLKEREILELFRKVCSAVSFAHQKLVVHRDLKPSNILVNQSGEPKLLDFGIAKLLDTADREHTQPHQMILTPRYASPEQLSGDLVGTAADVYSLGVLLQELLTGETANAEDSTTGSRPGVRKLDVDLQKVLGMATRKEVGLRYGSVEGFSRDIRHYLEGLPVAARRISVGYRLTKFVQRNRTMVTLAALLVLTFAAGLTATTLKAREAEHARAIADQRFENLRKFSGSFVTELHGAIKDLPGSLPARQLLLKRAAQQLDALALESGDDRELRHDLAEAYFNLSTLPDMPSGEKEPIQRRAIAIYDQLLVEDPNNSEYRSRLGHALIELADTVKIRGGISEGYQLSERALSNFETLQAEAPNDLDHLKDLRYAYANIANYRLAIGDANGSLDAARRALEISDRSGGSEPDRQSDVTGAKCRIQIGAALIDLHDNDGAVASLRTAVETLNRSQENDPNDTSLNYYLWLAERRLANAYAMSGDLVDAEKQARAGLAVMERLLAISPDDYGYHRNSAVSNVQMAEILLRQHRAKDAIPLCRRAMELSATVLERDPQYAESKMDMAEAKSVLGQALIEISAKKQGVESLSEAIRLFSEILNIDSQNAEVQSDKMAATQALAAAVAG